MAMSQSQDPLQLVPVDKWRDLQSALLSDWPRSLLGYNVLETQSRWKKVDLDCGFQVFCPFDDLRNGFVAIIEKASFYEIIIQYPKDNTKALEEALRETKVINWKSEKQLKLRFAADPVFSCVKKIIEDKNLEIKLTPNDLMYTFFKEKDSPLFEDVSLPPGHTLNLLTSDQVNLIDSYWPHRYPKSHTLFQLLIDAKSGYGLFKDDELISWILISECGYLTHLYTMEGHRKKGYAELLVKLISNAIIKDKKSDVIVFCLKKNENSRKLFEKIGFKQSDDVFNPDINTKIL